VAGSCVTGSTSGGPSRPARARTLEAAIIEYITVTNEQPRPFRWTKTADEILASVERFCRRISDSRD
jgi:hypothetical protein